ncbi:MAG: GntR family transcriptional regulator [Gemmatimonadota bacterium]|nr:GntR family transcriptional regulator [Gemmatimonadota bacterium]
MLFGRGDPGMSGYNFTEQVRKVLAMTREEAMRLRHEYVGTEHILLGLIRDDKGVAAAVLENLNADLDKIRRKIEATVKKGKAPPARPDLPYTSRAKKVLEFAMSEARELNHSYVGTEHLLLGLLREEKGIAAQVLNSAGVSVDAARAEMLRVFRTVAFANRAAPPRGESITVAPLTFHVRIDDESDRSIYEQIVGQVQEAVATGQLAPGARLPTVRQLADELDIAPGTVARAYVELERLGVVVTEGARGTRVAPLKAPGMPAADRPETLAGLLRPVAVAAFHLGASAQELREALEKAMKGIFGDGNRDAA